MVSGCGGESSPPAADSIVFDSSNATDIANMASLFAQVSPGLVSATGVESELPSSKAAIDIITELAFDRDRYDTNVAIGVIPGAVCTNGGSTSFEGSADTNSRTGTVSFNNCNEGGLIINGYFVISSTWDLGTGDYLNTGDGSITMGSGGQSFTLVLNFSSEGNSTTLDFSNDVYFSMSFPGYGAFSVETTAPIVGNFFGGIYSGVILVSGGQNTHIQITFDNGTTLVELDNGNGVFVEHPIY